MRLPDADDEQPLAWTAILEHTPVLTVDGNVAGTVTEIVGSEDEDIFHGIVVSLGALQRHVLVPAVQVKTITNRRIEIGIDDESLHQLDEYQPEASYHLGMIGHFRRRLGWIREDTDPHS